MALPPIQGVVGSVVAGTSIVNAFLVILQGVGFDVKGEDNVGFLFNYRDEDVVDLQSDITDHYSEGNSALQDQIALKPVTATLHGFTGELTDFKEGIQAEVQIIATQLTTFAPYVPQLTVAALQAYNQAQQTINAGLAAKAAITQAFNMTPFGGTSQTKQQKAYSYFKQKWLDRELFTVMTPWETLTNMAILSVHAVQEGDSQMVSDFRIVFKQMRFASTISSQSSLSQIAQGRRNAQAAQRQSQGAQNPLPVFDPAFGGSNSAVFTA